MSVSPEFTALHRMQRLSAQAADQIAHMILERQFDVGDKLPSERQLAEALGVSRTVVREAIRILEARKLVEVQTGSGAVVLGVGPGTVTESISMLLESPNARVSFDDIQAVRGVMEVATAGLAAVKATEEDNRRMRDALERMLKAATVDEQILADYDFHLEIAKATHNQLFVFLLQALNDILVKTWYDYWEVQAANGPADFLAADKEQTKSDTHHRIVFEAIQRGDHAGAREAMSRLLDHWSFMYSRKTETE